MIYLPLNPLKAIKNKRYTAIDFGHHSLKLVQCRAESDKISLLNWEKKRLPPGIINSGRIDNINIVRIAVSSLLRQLSVKTGDLLIAPAPGQEIVSRLEVPGPGKDVLQEEINEIIANRFNLSPEEVSRDHILLNNSIHSEDGNEDKKAVLLIAMPRDVLSSYQQVFKNSSISPSVANFQGLALNSLLTYQGLLQETGMIINMGSSFTKIIIASQDDYFREHSIEPAGNHFTEQLLANEAAFARAEEKKVSFDQNSMSIHKFKFRELVEKLCSEINRLITVHEKKYPQNPIEKLHLTGGGFKLPGLKDELSDRIERDIQLIEPLKGIKVDVGEMMEEEREMQLKSKDTLSVALGLVASEVLHNER